MDGVLTLLCIMHVYYCKWTIYSDSGIPSLAPTRAQARVKIHNILINCIFKVATNIHLS